MVCPRLCVPHLNMYALHIREASVLKRIEMDSGSGGSDLQLGLEDDWQVMTDCLCK